MRWDVRRLIIHQTLLLLLLLIFFIPSTRSLIVSLDNAFFHLLNDSLKGHPHWQFFWVLASHKLADWFHDIVFLTLFVITIVVTPRDTRVTKTAQFLFCTLYIAFIIYFINRLLFRNTLDIVRLSPTIEFPECLRLSKESSLGIKDTSKQSFPGDHATTALLLATSYSYFANKKLALFGWAYAIFMCLPRLIAGAHWFSDVAIGSGCIVIFFFSWAFYSPLSAKATFYIERFLRFLLRRPQTV